LNSPSQRGKEAIEGEALAHGIGRSKNDGVRCSRWNERGPDFPRPIEHGHTIAPKRDKRFRQGRTGLKNVGLPNGMQDADCAAAFAAALGNGRERDGRDIRFNCVMSNLVFIDQVTGT
jgi:hypothetical protein